MSNSAEDHVRKWLTENGQALELQVARSLIQSGIPVESSVMYDDPITGKRRETDLVIDLVAPKAAGRSRFASALLAAIECKHSANGSWVAIHHADASSDHPDDPGSWWWHGHESNVAAGQGLRDYLAVWPHGSIFSTENSKNTAYDAVRQALSASQALSTQRLPTQEDADSLQTALAGTGLAFVVTTAPLFSAHLSEDGDLAVEATDRLDAFVEDRLDKRRCVSGFTREGFTKWAPQLLRL